MIDHLPASVALVAPHTSTAPAAHNRVSNSMMISAIQEPFWYSHYRLVAK